MFVVSLAVADLIVAIYPYPLVLTSVFHNGWKLGYLHCQISGFLMGLSVIGSIFNITGIAINRYCYICHSLKYDKLYSDKNSLCYIVLIWVLTFVAIVPNLFVGSLQYDPRIYSCTFAQSVSSAYTIAVVFFHFLLPIAVVTFCYLRIWILVIQVRRRVKPDNNPRLKPHDFRNFVTMFVVFVLFAVCWAPLNFIGLAVAVNPKTVIPRIPEWLFVSSYYMAYFNSCLNAIVYGLLNQNFRREYKRIIVTFCTAKVFFQDSSNDAGDRMRSKPSPLITNNNQVKVDSVWKWESYYYHSTASKKSVHFIKPPVKYYSEIYLLHWKHFDQIPCMVFGSLLQSLDIQILLYNGLSLVQWHNDILEGIKSYEWLLFFLDGDKHLEKDWIRSIHIAWFSEKNHKIIPATFHMLFLSVTVLILKSLKISFKKLNPAFM